MIIFVYLCLFISIFFVDAREEKEVKRSRGERELGKLEGKKGIK